MTWIAKLHLWTHRPFFVFNNALTLQNFGLITITSDTCKKEMTIKLVVIRIFPENFIFHQVIFIVFVSE